MGEETNGYRLLAKEDAGRIPNNLTIEPENLKNLLDVIEIVLQPKKHRNDSLALRCAEFQAFLLDQTFADEAHLVSFLHLNFLDKILSQFKSENIQKISNLFLLHSQVG